MACHGCSESVSYASEDLTVACHFREMGLPRLLWIRLKAALAWVWALVGRAFCCFKRRRKLSNVGLPISVDVQSVPLSQSEVGPSYLSVPATPPEGAPCLHLPLPLPSRRRFYGRVSRTAQSEIRFGNSPCRFLTTQCELAIILLSSVSCWSRVTCQVELLSTHPR